MAGSRFLPRGFWTGGLLLVQEVQDGALGHGEGRLRQVQPGMCCWVVGLSGCWYEWFNTGQLSPCTSM
jgi:hypothetical protein